MQSTWETCLATLERLRAKAVETEDQDLARELVRRAAVFARMMVNTAVPVSEQWFTRYMRGGTIAPFHRKQVKAINRWAKKLDAVAFLQLTDWQQWRELQSIDGLGPAKAAMAVGLMGGHLACIDRHVFSHFMVTDNVESAKLYKQEVKPDKYQKLHWRFFGMQDSARNAQWRLFEKNVPAFAESGHWPYFEAIFSLV